MPVSLVGSIPPAPESQTPVQKSQEAYLKAAYFAGIAGTNIIEEVNPLGIRTRKLLLVRVVSELWNCGGGQVTVEDSENGVNRILFYISANSAGIKYHDFFNTPIEVRGTLQIRASAALIGEYIFTFFGAFESL